MAPGRMRRKGIGKRYRRSFLSVAVQSNHLEINRSTLHAIKLIASKALLVLQLNISNTKCTISQGNHCNGKERDV